jgi:hypothetical protein
MLIFNGFWVRSHLLAVVLTVKECVCVCVCVRAHTRNSVIAMEWESSQFLNCYLLVYLRQWINASCKMFWSYYSANNFLLVIAI